MAPAERKRWYTMGTKETINQLLDETLPNTRSHAAASAVLADIFTKLQAYLTTSPTALADTDFADYVFSAVATYLAD
jgi:hypothetical protein